jgi:tripartite-type tricarboxylate transporter receptor subunit TctC
MRILLATLALLISTAAAAQYPAKPIRVIVPFTPGGSADISARVVGAKLAERLGQAVVVENHAGGGGVLALELVKNAPADGYTLGIMANSNATKPATMRSLPWNLERDFAYIAVTVDATMVLVGNPERMSAQNLRELTGLLRASERKYAYGSCGVASTQHFAMEKYLYYAHATAVHVPYKGCAIATPDVASGHIELALVTLSNALPYIRAGKLRAYGVTTATRNPVAPDVPTFRESGVPELKDYEQGAWYGFGAPAGTAPPIVEQLAKEIESILATRDVQEKLRAAGLEPAFRGPREMAAMMQAEVASFTRLTAAAHITAE